MENIFKLLEKLVPVLLKEGFKVEFDHDLDGSPNYGEDIEGIEPVVYDDDEREEWCCQLFLKNDSKKDGHVDVLTKVLGKPKKVEELKGHTYVDGKLVHDETKNYFVHEWVKKKIQVLTWTHKDEKEEMKVLITYGYTKR